MREIKFRAWDNGFSKLISWEDIEKNCNLNIFNSKYFIVEQFTGLRDKNGREIYEGDVLKHCEMLFPVKYDFGMFYGDGEHDDLNFDSVDYNELEVIGNIHESEVK